MSGLHRSAELLQGQNFVVYGKKLVYLRLEVLLGFGFHDSVGYCSAKGGGRQFTDEIAGNQNHPGRKGSKLGLQTYL